MKTIDIDKFNGFETKINYEPIMKKHAGKAKNILIATSPSSGRPKRKTPYRLGWDFDESDLKHGYMINVWNKTNWQLTHLLENGHFISNHEALAWSAPRKHIRDAYLKVKKGYLNDMQQAKVELDFK